MSNTDKSLQAANRFFIPIVLGIMITIATGLVHGRLSQRWGPGADLEAAGRHLERFPGEIGDWQMLSNEPLSELVERTLACAGYVNRRYVNRQTGDTISMAMIVGPPGPTAVHTPEICYSSRAYSIQEPRQRVTLSDKEGRTHTFWALLFRSNNPLAGRLHVYYAWLDKATWKASESPRFEYGGRDLLFKVQVASEAPAGRNAGATDPAQEFLAELLRSEWRPIGGAL